MKNQITIGSRVRLKEDTSRFQKGHEFTVYGHSYRGFDLVDSDGNKMDECLFIHDKLELIEEPKNMREQIREVLYPFTDHSSIEEEEDLLDAIINIFKKHV